MRKNRHVIAALLAGTMGILAPSQAWAQEGQAYHFDMPSQDLGDALRSVAARAGWELYAQTDDVNGKAAPALRGSLTARDAIERLLQGSNLEARFDGGAVIIRGRRETSTDTASASVADIEIVVTGTHIAGAAASSPVATIRAEDIKRAGQADLGEVVRSLPQNFAGGQNPGIGTSQGAGNANVNGASSVNLLGMGPNATLTLLNGNRISYTGVNAAIDISSIPAVAVDRFDVITDGASAIYGADAVAGVVNVVLRRDYDGASIGARLGSSTDGGSFQQQYNAVVGHSWRSGSILAAYDYLTNTAIFAHNRSYAIGMAPDTTLYPKLTRHSGVVTLTQELTSHFRATADFLYKDTKSYSATGYDASTSVLANGGTTNARSKTLSFAPSLEMDIGESWTAKLVASYGYDKTHTKGDIYFGGSRFGSSYRLYNNEALSVELSATGALVELPAGPLRLAVGGGYRRTTFEVESTTLGTTATAFETARTAGYGFGELHVPIASPDGNHSLVRSLTLIAAARYEDNSGVEAVTTPKLGLIYEPVDGLSLKANWGKSFRLPTFYQQYSGYSAILLPVSGYGSLFPPGSTFLELLGSSPSMKPERSESWTVSAEFTPHVLPGLSGALTWFHFDYSDRIATPLLSAAGVLTNPNYANLVTLSPSAEELASLISGASLGLQNATGSAYNPARVIGVFDDRDRNVARQRYKGVNLSLKYSMDVGSDGKLDLAAAVTWIKSQQQLGPGLPCTDLAGTIFNPPHWKSRLGISYSTPVLSISAFGNLANSVIDNRRPPFVGVGVADTLDLAAQFKVGHGLEVGLTINNLTNAKPTRIATTSAFDTPYDTTNYNSIGRFLAFSIRKNW